MKKPAPNKMQSSRKIIDARLIYGARLTRDAARSMIAVLIAIYLNALGFSIVQIGAVLAISVFGGLVLSSLVMSTTGMSSRKVWFISLSALTGFAGILLISTDNIFLIGLGAFFGSYAASGSHVGPMIQLEQSSLTDISRSSNRTRSFSYLSMSSSIGRAIGLSLVGISTYLINVQDFELITAYKITLGIYIGFNFVGALIYLRLSNSINSNMSKEKRWSNPIRSKSRKSILRLSALFGLDSFAGGMIYDAFVAFWLFTKFDLNEGIIAAVFFVTQIVNFISLWLAPYIAKRVGLLNTFVWTQVVSNLTLIAFAFSPYASLAIILWILRGLFDEMDVPTRQSYSMGIVRPEDRNVMAGTANLGRSIGRVPSSTVTGALWSGTLTPLPWLIAASLKLSYNLVVYYSYRNLKPPEETSPD